MAASKVLLLSSLLLFVSRQTQSFSISITQHVPSTTRSNLFQNKRHQLTHQRSFVSYLSSSLSSNGVSVTTIQPADWREQILAKLSTINDPDLNMDIVTLKFIKNLSFDPATGTASFDIELTTPACPVKDSFQSQAYNLVTSLDFVSDAQITMTAQPIQQQTSGEAGMTKVANVIAISSCKGGVGKSTTAVNFAYALKSLGARVGIFDADVYGPSLPTMVVPKDDAVRFIGRQISPLEYEGVKLMSFGYVNDGAAIMRGPMIDQLLNQFLTVVNWGELDYLILDMPPGTGDIQLTLSQRLNITAAVIVTTPQELSYVDVARGIDMFGSVEVPCVAVVENMAYYEPKEEDNRKYRLVDGERLKKAFVDKLAAYGVDSNIAGLDDVAAELVRLVEEQQQQASKDSTKDQVRIFGPGHLNRLSTQFGIDHTFAMPLMKDIAISGDAGVPFILRNPDSPQAAIFKQLASAVVSEVAKLKYKSGGSSRMGMEFDATQHLLMVKDSDAATYELKPATLRRDCKCAACVEEMTGQQILQPQSVSELIKPTSIIPCGNYALSVNWSDGHRSLYPYRQIRALVRGAKSSEAARPSVQKEMATK